MPLGLSQNQTAPETTVNRLLLGRLSLTLTGDTALDDTQAGNRFIDFTGTPGAAVAVTVPNTPKEWIIRNTSGQTVTVKTSAGTGVAVDDGNNAHLYTDGVEVYALAQAGTPEPSAEIQAYKLVADLLAFDNHWRLDETTGTTAVDSVGSADATLTGGVTVGVADSPIHLSGLKAMTFDGTSGYLDLGSALNTALSAIGTGDFAASFWIKTTATSGFIFYWGPTTGTDFDRTWIDLRAGGVARAVANNQGSANEIALGVTSINDDAWHHIVAVRVSGTRRLYADGVEDVSAASVANLDTLAGHVARIGVTSLDNGFLAASLADFALKTSGGLTAAQIRALCEAGVSFTAATSISKSPALYLRMNETAGTVATDYSFNGTDGTYAGGVTLGVADSPITNEPGAASASFNGVDGRIEGLGLVSSYSFIENTGIFSIRFWAKMADYADDAAQYFAGSNNISSAGKGFGIAYENRASQGAPQALRLIIATAASGGSDIINASFNAAISDNNWHQYVFVGDAANVVLHIDTVAFGPPQAYAGAFGTGDSGATVAIGRTNNSLIPFAGQLAEFAIAPV